MSSSAEKGMPSAEVVAVDLPAPAGWKKKLAPKTSGTPKKNEIVFISPTGQEIRTKKQLDQYIKAHPGGPRVSEFDWGTGHTPRRSARISEKVKVTESPEDEPTTKRAKKCSPEKVGEEKKDSVDEESKDVPDGHQTHDGADTDMNEADRGDKVDEKVVTEEAEKNEGDAQQAKEAIEGGVHAGVQANEANEHKVPSDALANEAHERAELQTDEANEHEALAGGKIVSNDTVAEDTVEQMEDVENKEAASGSIENNVEEKNPSQNAPLPVAEPSERKAAEEKLCEAVVHNANMAVNQTGDAEFPENGKLQDHLHPASAN